MTDELGRIKERAAERRDEVGTDRPDTHEYLMAEADLDRAITIAEQRITCV